MRYVPYKPSPLNDPFAADRPLRRVIIDESQREERWPARPRIEPADRVGSDAQTARMIAIRRVMEANGFPRLMDWIDEWKCLRAQKQPSDQQPFIAELVAEVREKPAQREALVMLAWICEPARGGITKDLQAFLDDATIVTDQQWRSPTESQAIRDLDRERLGLVTRRAVVEAFYRYPDEPPRFFSRWVNEVISLRAIEHLRDNLAAFAGSRLNAEVLRRAELALNGADRPKVALASEDGLGAWLKLSDYETVYTEDVWPITRQLRLQRICGDAVGRLARRQEQILTDSYWGEKTPEQIAASRTIARQTVYSTRGQAERKLGRDLTFYSELRAIAALRPEPALESLRLPDNRLGD